MNCFINNYRSITSLSIICILLVPSAIAHSGLDLNSGFTFTLSDENTNITAGNPFVFDEFNIYRSDLALEGNNLSLSTDSSTEANSTLWIYNLTENNNHNPLLKIAASTSDTTNLSFTFDGFPAISNGNLRLQKNGNFQKIVSGDIVMWYDTNWSTDHNFSIIPNHFPTIQQGNDFTNYTDRHAFNVTAVAKDVDGGSSEFSSCTVIHNNSETKYESTGTLNTGYGGADDAECRLTIEIGEGDFTEYEPNEKISVRVNFTDKYGESAITSMTSNTIPNDPPTIHLDDTHPSAPVFGDEVEIFANVSEPENDVIQWANFTIWEYNQDQEQLLIDSANGTVTQDGSYQIWDSDNITADLENGTYNWTIAVSDSWVSTEETSMFTLEEVSPNASSPMFKIADPWDVQTDMFRPDQTVAFTTDIVDLNGRSDLSEWYANISSPSGLEDSYRALTEESIITNGYTVSGAYSLTDSAQEGTWSVTMWGEDQQGLIGQNSSTFEVKTYDNVSIRHTVNLTGSIETRSGDLEYVMVDNDPVLTGLINYDGFLEKSASSNTYVNVSMTQSFTDNQFIMPYTAASISQVDNRADALSSSLLGSRTFLDYNIASIAYQLHDELDVAIELSYFDDDRIHLEGFNGSLGRGQHELIIENTGVNNGSTVVEVQR